MDVEIDTLRKMGVKFELNYVVGRTRTIDDMIDKVQGAGNTGPSAPIEQQPAVGLDAKVEPLVTIEEPSSSDDAVDALVDRALSAAADLGIDLDGLVRVGVEADDSRGRSLEAAAASLENGPRSS